MSGEGELAIVLHTHMPYVEGFGTWPFGEEWLWEAMACCYVPLVELLDSGAALTLSMTPALCDQLQAPDLYGRFERFVTEVRAFTHHEDASGLRAAGEELLAAELERSLGDYERACEQLKMLDGDLLAALAAHARWTSSATHAILPLLGDDALLRAQIRTGVRSHKGRSSRDWQGGFWLPECAYAPHINGALIEAGVRVSCIEIGNLQPIGAAEHLRPLHCDGGLLLAPIDRQSIALVWSEQGYPAHGHYRDSYRRTIHNRNPWRNDGSAYDHDQAVQTAQQHARDFVERVKGRLQQHGAGLPGGGLVVFAADTELFGLWWYEGLTWLAAVVQECERQGLDLVALEDAQALADPACATDVGLDRAPAGSWGYAGSLETWSGAGSRLHRKRPISDAEALQRAAEVAQMASQLRCAEQSLLASGAQVSDDALRALLAAQASDWAFMAFNGDAVPYAQERSAGHLERMRQELSGRFQGESEQHPELALRGIARYVRRADLLAPPPPAIGR